MVAKRLHLVALACCLTAACSGAAPQDAAGDSKESAAAALPIAGLWSGSWGGGERDGVIFQPVIADLLIEMDHVELLGFRNVDRLTGTVRFDASIKLMQVTPAAEDAGRDVLAALNYTYEIKGNELTLIDSDGVTTSLRRVPTADDPLGNARVELVEATGINDAGDLLVTEFTVLQAGRAGTVYFRPDHRALKTSRATVRRVLDAGFEDLTIEEARRQIEESTPVAIVYLDDIRSERHQAHKLWQEAGSPPPDSVAAWRTLSRILRPGTFVFILSASENVPKP